jgi:predicted TIM-barrel fold metal-dependent hydrolase
MIIDVNNTIGKHKFKPEIKAKDFVKTMDQAGVDMAVVFCYASSLDNDSIAKAMDEFPDRLIGLYTVNPWMDNAVDQLKSGLEAGFKGLRLHAVRHGYAMNELRLLSPLLEVCQKSQVPVWAYGAAEVFSSPILFQDLAEAYKDVALIMGHMGYSYEATSAMGVAQRNKNVYLDTAGSMFINYVRAVERVPIDQVLLGTGTPDFGFFELEIQKVKDATDNIEIQKKISGENAAKLFGIKS